MMSWSEGDPHGITVTVPDQLTLLQEVAQCLGTGTGFSIATLNLDHVVKLSQNAQFRDAYHAHTYVVADGNPIVWLSRLAGQKVALVPGSELIEPLIAQAAQSGVPVAFFGGQQATLEKAAQMLSTRHPGLDVVLCRAPDMGFDPLGPAAEEDIAALRASGARLVFLALGAPKQEVFAARAQAELPGVGLVSIGAGLDFIAGTQKRAPAWVRHLSAEWLWRLLSNPQRLFRRYAACLYILPALTGKALKTRQRDKKTS